MNAIPKDETTSGYILIKYLVTDKSRHTTNVNTFVEDAEFIGRLRTVTLGAAALEVVPLPLNSTLCTRSLDILLK